MPPLRQRPQDIPLLVWAFVREFQKRMGKEIETISKKTMEALQAYAWPGNIRELKNVIEHSMILSSHSKLIVTLPQFESSRKKETQQLEDIERMHITSVLKSTGWQVGGKGGASEILGLKRSTLYSKMKKLGIVRTEF
jgi:DNA-binding NtrC family response regulator